MSTPTDMPADPFVTGGDKYRLSDEEMNTLRDALVIARLHFAQAAQTATLIGATIEAEAAKDIAQRFDDLLVASANVTRVTVRF